MAAAGCHTGVGLDCLLRPGVLSTHPSRGDDPACQHGTPDGYAEPVMVLALIHRVSSNIFAQNCCDSILFCNSYANPEEENRVDSKPTNYRTSEEEPCSGGSLVTILSPEINGAGGVFLHL